MTLFIAALAASLLGLRFAVWVLGPAIVFSVAFVILGGIESGAGVGSLAMRVLGVMAFIQIGYLAGCIVRVGLAKARSSKYDGILPAKPV